MNGQVSSVVQPGQSAPLAGTSTPRKKRNTKSKPNGFSSAADANSRTIAITLPKDIVEWYEHQAATAPFEPSVQRFISWELRQLANNRQAAAELAAADDDPTMGVNDLR
jgi:hypothetical protein